MDARHVGFWVFALIAGILLGLLVRAIVLAEVEHRPLLALGSYDRLEQELDRLRAEVGALRTEKDALLRQLLTGELSAEQIRQELEAAKHAAGLTPVSGPGVEVVLGDSSRPGGALVERGLVHDYDLLFLINELRAAGAEAISIGSGRMEERLTALSYLRCTGPTVLVNNTRLSAPFTIKALGDSDTLVQALKMPGGVVEQLQAYGLDITVAKAGRLEIPAYSLPLSSRFAEDGQRTAAPASPPVEENPGGQDAVTVEVARP